MRYLLVVFLFFTPLQGKDFFLLTLPKSGTHMMYKFFTQLTGKRDGCLSCEFPTLSTHYFYDDGCFIDPLELEEQCALWKWDNIFPAGHLNFSEPFQLFSQNHPEYEKMILVRDLRDVLVSQAYFEFKGLEQEIGPSPMEAKILYLITLKYQNPVMKCLDIYRQIERAFVWLDDPATLLLRYEDFVGEKGGGDLETQMDAMRTVASFLDLSPSNQEILDLARSIHGKVGAYNPYVTFRKGQIGEWKELYTEETKEAFKHVYGDFLVRLGYEEDFSW